MLLAIGKKLIVWFNFECKPKIHDRQIYIVRGVNMSWTEIKNKHADIAYYYTKIGRAKRKSKLSVASEVQIKRLWSEFCVLVNKPTEGHVPFIQILKVLNAQAEHAGKDNVAILDHGCNQAFSLLYLAARGFTNIYGVDLEESNCSKLNSFTRNILGLSGTRFYDFDGDIIPLADDSIDFVISQTVVEHVEPHLLENYYREASRVLVEGGKAYYDIPVRSNLYDSHTGLWLLHYFPRSIWLFLLGVLRGAERQEWARRHLFLRSRSRLKGIAKKFFGNVDDITFNRLIDAQTSDHFVGGGRLNKTRQALTKFFIIPFFGPLLAKVLVPFVMMSTLSTKVVSRDRN